MAEETAEETAEEEQTETSEEAPETSKETPDVSSSGPWAWSPEETENTRLDAPPVNYQNVVILLGTGLVLVNFWSDVKLTWGAITHTSQVNDWGQIGKDAGMSLLFLILIGFFAGISPGTGKISVAIVAALWIALLLNKKGGSTGIGESKATHP